MHVHVSLYLCTGAPSVQRGVSLKRLSRVGSHQEEWRKTQLLVARRADASGFRLTVSMGEMPSSSRSCLRYEHSHRLATVRVCCISWTRRPL